MSKVNKSVLALALGLITIMGVAGAASARWGGPMGGGPCGYGYNQDAAQALSPEAQKIMESAYDKMAPLVMELRAKQDEFTAKLYSGADSKTMDALGKDITRLQTQVTEARLALQQQLAQAGVPLRYAAGGCMMAGGMMGGGMRGPGPCARQ